MTTIAVTGGSGFIGTATLRAAQEAGHEAWSFDRESGNNVLASLDDLAGARVVIHLAGALGTGELFNTPEEALRINTQGSLRIMEWCIQNGAKYVGITMPDVFPSIYTATKIAALRLADAYSHSKGLNAAHVRAFNVFGPGQKVGPGHPQKIIPTFATRAWTNQPIPVWGDGQQGVDLIHVDDVARILLWAATSDCNGIVDAGNRVCFTVLEVAQFISMYTKHTAGILLLPMRDGEIPTKIAAEGEGWNRQGFPNLPTYGSSSRILEQLKGTIDWYRGRS